MPTPFSSQVTEVLLEWNRIWGSVKVDEYHALGCDVCVDLHEALFVR